MILSGVIFYPVSFTRIAILGEDFHTNGIIKAFGDGIVSYL